MKIRIVYIFLCFFFIFQTFFSQDKSIETNIVKYWNYRERLVNNFMVVGKERGQSLPFSIRNYMGQGKMKQGEGPINLGNYMAILATEYNILKQSNEDISQTIKELYYALYAINRLDLFAETTNGYNKKAKLDGFFVRNDFPSSGFISDNPTLNEQINKKEEFIYGEGKSFKVKCILNIGVHACKNIMDANCNIIEERYRGYAEKYNHIPYSLDQFLGILLGLTFVDRFVDENANFSNNKFQDDEVFLKKEAQNITDRMITYLQKHNWVPKEPDGTYVGDCDFDQNKKPTYWKNNATMQWWSRFIAKIGNNITDKKYKHPAFSDLLTGVLSVQSDKFGDKFYNLRMYIEALTLSDLNNTVFTSTAKRVKNISKKYNWQAYYYTMGYLLHDWKYNNEIENDVRDMLIDAPCSGPYFHSKDDIGRGGWATENRFSSTIGEQYYGHKYSVRGNYVGLDYMLLHNLYILAYTNKQTKSLFGKLKNNNSVLCKTKRSSSTNTLKYCYKAKIKSCNERVSANKKIYKDHYKICTSCFDRCFVKCNKGKENCTKICKKECKITSNCKDKISKYFKVRYKDENYNPLKTKCNKRKLKQECNELKNKTLK